MCAPHLLLVVLLVVHPVVVRVAAVVAVAALVVPRLWTRVAAVRRNITSVALVVMLRPPRAALAKATGAPAWSLPRLRRALHPLKVLPRLLQCLRRPWQKSRSSSRSLITRSR